MDVARAVEQHVERGFGCRQRRDRGRVRHVEPARGDARAGRVGVGREPRECGFVDVRRQYVGAFAREAQRGRAADALTGGRDQRAFALQSHEPLSDDVANARRPPYIGAMDQRSNQS